GLAPAARKPERSHERADGRKSHENPVGS
ncbi:MAG: hypothetical protein QOG83_3570, partial [Alphaproteobacteria bacterium]|nr:hypothetical protein [Alphaproteobacteria bacterium]